MAANLEGIKPGRLFWGSCLALIATSVTFAVISAIMGPLKTQFMLTNQQVGWIGGAALFGFPISIFIFGPLCDVLGLRFLVRLAFVTHLGGAVLMMLAGGDMAFWMLFLGAWTISLGNGLVEAACNPLVATIYPDRKTEKLNQFHVWFPGGIVLGGLASFGLDSIGITPWQIKIGLIIIPTILYGIVFFGQKFPPTESHAAGVSFGQMFAETFARPLFWLIIICMAMTASLELGPNRWIPAVLESGGIHGILVLVWISGLMAVLRFFAGPVVERLAPTGILVASAVLTGIGLTWLSFSSTTAMAFAAATVFAVGVCYFWPTMLGVTSERVPKGGALALAVVGGVGMLAVGLVTSPLMGRIADGYVHERLDPQETIQILGAAALEYNAVALEVEAESPEKAGDYRAAAEKAASVVAQAQVEGDLPDIETANALRLIIQVDDALKLADSDERAAAVLNPADNYGGKMSFRYIVPLSVILLVIFGGLWLKDRASGGYRIERLGAGS